MQAKIKRSYYDAKKWTVQINHGHQFFTLDIKRNKKEALWFKRQFDNALKLHNAELLAKFAKYKPVRTIK